VRRAARATASSQSRRSAQAPAAARGRHRARLPDLSRLWCCGGELHRIGEDVAERLDVIAAQFRVIVPRRPRAWESALIQTAAPARLIEGGLPTEALAVMCW
jgi:transposase